MPWKSIEIIGKSLENHWEIDIISDDDDDDDDDDNDNDDDEEDDDDNGITYDR